MNILVAAIALVFVVFVVISGLRMAFPLPVENFAEPGKSLPPDWNGPLGQAIWPAVQLHPGLTGVMPLTDGRAAFTARAVLAQEAASTIDAQYYIWQDDTTGLMLLDELRTAADRGVRVRLLLDDNGIPGLDTLLAELDGLPNAEVRIFNPFTLRKPKLLSYVFDFQRLNRRMHNKSMTADGVISLVGGRNIGDIYFEYGEGTHYFDVDALAVGPIVNSIAASFDAYWNSGSAYAANRILASATGEEIAKAAEEARATALGVGYQRAIEENALARRLQARNVPLEWGLGKLLVDDPSKGLGHATDDQIVVEKLLAVAAECKTSLDLVSAYFIPGPRGAELLQKLARTGVRTRILTNSLDATDVMPVHAAYMGYRKGLIKSGVELFELKAMREEHVERSLPEMLAGSASGLHAKVFAFDGLRVFIGSYNLDPRSARLNTEMGLLIESPSIAKRLSEQLDNPIFAYRVQTDESDALVWFENSVDGKILRYVFDPKSSFVKRATARLVSRLPLEWML